MCFLCFVFLNADVIDNTNMYGRHKYKNCGKILERESKSCIFLN